MTTRTAIGELVQSAYHKRGGRGDSGAVVLRGMHLTKRITLTLPYPPSANRYWRQGKNGRVYVSPEAESYKNEVFWLCVKQSLHPFDGDVKLTLDFYRPRKSGDLSNRIKVLEDALQNNAYHDDKQVVEIHARRFDDKRRPRVEVEITEI